jgi:hypothetical protein
MASEGSGEDKHLWESLLLVKCTGLSKLCEGFLELREGFCNGLLDLWFRKTSSSLVFCLQETLSTGGAWWQSCCLQLLSTS